MAFSKINYHVAANCGGCSGIQGFWDAMIAAGVPLVVYSTNDAGLIASAAARPAATLVYRDTEASTVNPADYSIEPETAALAYWARHRERVPAEIKALKGRVWLELLNEPGREDYQANWVGWMMFHMARLALAEGWRVMGPGWAPGNPEPGHWEYDGWRAYLGLCAAHPDKVAVSLHEYSLETDIHFAEGWLIGRFEFLFDACDEMGIRRPNVFITECGWAYNAMPDDEQAQKDIAFLAELYAAHSEIKAAFLWTLQAGKGNGNLPARLNALMPWLADYNASVRFDDPTPAEPPDEPDKEPTPVDKNRLFNPSFENGHYDLYNDDGERLPIQVPNTWEFRFDSYPTAVNPFDAAEHSRFGQPETNVLHKSRFPETEWAQFGLHKNHIYKWFGKAHRGRLVQEVPNLPAGDYLLRFPIFADAVMDYDTDKQKVWADDPRACLVRVKANEAEIPLGLPLSYVVAPIAWDETWYSLPAGRLTVVEARFSHPGGKCKVALQLMMPYALKQNGVFIDDVSLTGIGNDEEEPVEEKHLAVVAKLPQGATLEERLSAATQTNEMQRTLTASHHDMVTILKGGNASSYVEMFFPERQPDVVALLAELGYHWVEVKLQSTAALADRFSPPVGSAEERERGELWN